MRTEKDPFVMLTVRLYVGSLIFNVMFLFVMGWLGEAESPQRLDLAFWRYRPAPGSCGWEGSCTEDAEFISNPGSTPDASCRCEKGILVGWDSQWYVFGALAAGV